MYIEKIVPIFKEIDYTGMVEDTSTHDVWGHAHEKRLVCPICFFTLHVYPNGDVYPCCSEEDPSGLGNITATSLAEIWTGEKHRSFLKMQLNQDRMKNRVCKDCIAPDIQAKPEDALDDASGRLLERL